MWRHVIVITAHTDMITGTLAVAQAQTQGTTLKEVTFVSLHVAVQSPLTRVTQPMSPYPCFFKTVYFDIINLHTSNSDKW